MSLIVIANETIAAPEREAEKIRRQSLINTFYFSILIIFCVLFYLILWSN